MRDDIEARANELRAWLDRRVEDDLYLAWLETTLDDESPKMGKLSDLISGSSCSKAAL